MRLPSIEANNRTFTRGLALLPSVAGSAISVMLIAASVWAVISIALRRYGVRYAPTDRYVVLPTLFYTAIMGASIVGHANALDDLGFLVTPCFYLVPAILLPRYRIYPDDYFDIFLRTVPWCSILALPLIAWQGIYDGDRVIAMAGNAYPFAMICATLGPASLLALDDREGSRAVVPLLGFLAAVLGVLLSGTRTAWLAFALDLIVLAWFFAGSRLGGNRRLAVAAAIALAVVLALSAGPVASRSEGLVHDVVTIARGGAPSETLSARLGMWGAAVTAFRERPLTGYGAENRRHIIREISVRVGASGSKSAGIEALDYSHFHNGFLTAAVDAGVLGALAALLLLLSPVLLIARAPPDRLRRKRIAFGGFFVITYAITGSFNIMFGQDLIDALWITGLLMLALSVRPQVTGGTAGETK